MSDQIIHLLEDVRKEVRCLKEEIKELNGQVAKHSEWINRYDIRVAEKFPEVEKATQKNTKYIFAAIAALGVLEVTLKVLF